MKLNENVNSLQMHELHQTKLKSFPQIWQHWLKWSRQAAGSSGLT